MRNFYFPIPKSQQPECFSHFSEQHSEAEISKVYNPGLQSYMDR